MTFIQWGLLVASITAGALGAIFLKLGAPAVITDGGVARFIESTFLNWRLVLGFLLYIIPSISIVYLLKFFEITFLQPILALTYVMTAVFAYFFLNETIGPARLLGVFLILAGIFFVSRSQQP